jgi:long-chain acyl-CoA synthetase
VPARRGPEPRPAEEVSHGMASLLKTILLRGLRHPKRVSIVDDQSTSTYFRTMLATYFLANFVKKQTSNPHVGIILPTSGATAVSILGCWQAGKVPIPINFLLGPEELHYVIAHSGVDTIITATKMLEHLGGREKLPTGLNVIELDKQKFGGIPPIRWPRDPKPDEVATILYTSGTSGKPKGVVLTQGNLYSNVTGAVKHAKLSWADTFLGVLPQFHSFGLTALTLIPLYLGAKVVYTARFVPRRLVELVKEHRPEIFMAVPSMYGAILGVKNVKPDDFKSMRMPISGGEPLPAAVREQCKTKLGINLLEGYGLTETSPVTSWCAPHAFRDGSVGTLLPDVDVQIVDDKDQPLGRNQDGEILISGPNIMRGYYKQDDLTKEVTKELTIDGKPRKYFRSGDIGKLDADGFLYITGRKKEMLIVGGENVFPRDIEEVLNRHPAIRDSAVIGKSDDLRGEVPVAFIEIEEGHTFDESAIRAFCRENLANYKVPREINKVDQLPRSPTGKILRRKLKEQPPVSA